MRNTTLKQTVVLCVKTITHGLHSLDTHQQLCGMD